MTIKDMASAQIDAPEVGRSTKRADRAGFWRRFAAFLIDYLVIFVPLFILMAALFSFTNGGISSSFLLRWNACYHGVSVTLGAISDLNAADYDWTFCQTSAFGFPVDQWATATPKPEAQLDPSASSRWTLNYAVDSQHNFRSSPLDVGFLEWVILFCYLFAMEKKWGRSLGKRIMSIAVYDNYDIDRRGLPTRKAFERQGAKFFGFLPAIFLEAAHAFQYWGVTPETADPMSAGNLFAESFAVFVVSLIACIWLVWIAVSIIRTGNPVHDQVAATSVRVRSKSAYR